MGQLSDHMPRISISNDNLIQWGQNWLAEVNEVTGERKRPQRFDRQQSVNFGYLFDTVVGEALSSMLGDVPVVSPTGRSAQDALLPPEPDCVEVGPAKIIGGIRPQFFDVAYRPDGVRFAFDSKTLNDVDSIGKNWQNMINDLGTEAATVHTRFPHAIVAFFVVIPHPALQPNQQTNIIRTLERLATRVTVQDQTHLAEAISFIVWHPDTGIIDNNIPDPSSNLRIETFSETIYKRYLERYKGLPPHD